MEEGARVGRLIYSNATVNGTAKAYEQTTM